MSKLKIGSIGYVLGFCPVLVISYPTQDHYQTVIYLREPTNTRKYAHNNQYHKGDKAFLIAIHKTPRLSKYQITPDELAYATQLRLQYQLIKEGL